MLAPNHQEPQPQQPPPTFLKGQVQLEGKTYPYLLLPPLEVLEDRSYPLVLFLHGIGECGTDNEIQKAHFPARMAQPELARRFGAYVLAPQCPPEDSWANPDSLHTDSFTQDPEPTEALRGAISCLAEVIREHPIDLNRMALTGLSMGGAGTWDLALRFPDVFSAVAPVCGGSDPSQAHRLAGLPLMVWHGDADSEVSVERSRAMIKALGGLKLGVQYTEVPGVGHNSWDNAYGPGGCLDDLFAARRDPAGIQVATAKLLAQSLRPDERIAFLGDSITQAGNSSGGFVDLLRTVLRDARPDVQVIPAGISGHKVPDLLKRFEADVINKQATLVYIYIGINDVWHSKSGKGTPPDVFEKGLRALITRLKSAGVTVVLTTPSVIGEKAQGSNGLDAMLEEYAAISRQVATETGATLCDLSQAFHQHLLLFNPKGLEHSVLTQDGVHLNSDGNHFVAIQAARSLRRAVLSRR
jgi:lysophospholipase L1-like esterase/poly(3-hydroxybutyrate) depolymerase